MKGYVVISVPSETLRDRPNLPLGCAIERAFIMGGTLLGTEPMFSVDDGDGWVLATYEMTQ